MIVADVYRTQLGLQRTRLAELSNDLAVLLAADEGRHTGWPNHASFMYLLQEVENHKKNIRWLEDLLSYEGMTT